MGLMFNLCCQEDVGDREQQESRPATDPAASEIGWRDAASLSAAEAALGGPEAHEERLDIAPTSLEDWKMEDVLGPTPEFEPVLAGKSRTVFITSDKDSGGSGMLLDLLDGCTATVAELGSGAIMAWNDKNPDGAIRVNDGIIEVNGVRGDARALATRLVEDVSLCIVVHRPAESLVCVSQVGEPLGVDLAYVNTGRSLLITQVGGGRVQAWNASHRGDASCKLVQEGDRIGGVNGYEGPAKQMLQRLKAAVRERRQLELKILHACSEKRSLMSGG